MAEPRSTAGNIGGSLLWAAVLFGVAMFVGLVLFASGPTIAHNLTDGATSVGNAIQEVGK